MTKEEAIKILNSWDGVYIGYSSDEVNEAIKMSTEALEQEPCEDCINRKAVHVLIHELEEALVYEKNYISRERDTTTIIEDILALPPVTPKQRTGHWISLDDFRGRYNEKGFKCSECDERSSFEESFCPGCGAKMESEEE